MYVFLTSRLHHCYRSLTSNINCVIFHEKRSLMVHWIKTSFAGRTCLFCFHSKEVYSAQKNECSGMWTCIEVWWTCQMKKNWSKLLHCKQETNIDLTENRTGQNYLLNSIKSEWCSMNIWIIICLFSFRKCYLSGRRIGKWRSTLTSVRWYILDSITMASIWHWEAGFLRCTRVKRIWE